MLQSFKPNTPYKGANFPHLNYANVYNIRKICFSDDTNTITLLNCYAATKNRQKKITEDVRLKIGREK